MLFSHFAELVLYVVLLSSMDICTCTCTSMWGETCDVTPTAILNLLDGSVNFGSKFCASCRSNLRRQLTQSLYNIRSRLDRVLAAWIWL